MFFEFSSKKHVKDALLVLFLKVLILNSSAIVRIYSKTLQTISELIQTRSELNSTGLELTEVSHPFISAIWVIVPFDEWSKNQMFSERFNARLKNV